VVDTQRFPPYRTKPSRLFFWEEGEVKKQIDALVMLGKMKPNTLKYTCKVTLHVKKDGNHKLCGDCKPLNLQA
jgi:hypothetical protein